MADDWDEEVETAAAAAVDIVSPAEVPEIKLFGKWSCDEVSVSDMSLQVREPML
jgi:small subunit ribosomal protein S5e